MLPPGWDASPSQGYPQHYAGTHLYTWVERGTVRVKRLAQERNTMSPARPRTRTTRSGVERTNHEATAPPTLLIYIRLFCLIQETNVHFNRHLKEPVNLFLGFSFVVWFSKQRYREAGKIVRPHGHRTRQQNHEFLSS